MKISKVIIFILIIWFLPLKVFGFFASPDRYIHSMPFGGQQDYLNNEQALPPPGFGFDTERAGIENERNIQDDNPLQEENPPVSGKTQKEIFFDSPLKWWILAIVLSGIFSFFIKRIFYTRELL